MYAVETSRKSIHSSQSSFSSWRAERNGLDCKAHVNGDGDISAADNT